jgi:hypothetical protein
MLLEAKTMGNVAEVEFLNVEYSLEMPWVGCIGSYVGSEGTAGNCFQLLVRLHVREEPRLQAHVLSVERDCEMLGVFNGRCASGRGGQRPSQPGMRAGCQPLQMRRVSSSVAEQTGVEEPPSMDTAEPAPLALCSRFAFRTAQLPTLSSKRLPAQDAHLLCVGQDVELHTLLHRSDLN